MRVVQFPEVTIETTALGLGCAGLMRLTSASERMRLLETAFDSGIRHFDVARLYGLGAAEREVGRFARGRRDQVVIATKFGIDPAPGAGRLGRFQAPARALLNRYPRLRAAVKRRGDAFKTGRRYDAAVAERSLETSLREMATDYVDIFFLHGPSEGDSIDYEGLREFFDRKIQAGTIRSVGISHEAMPGVDLIGPFGDHAILQARSTVFDRCTDARVRLTFGVLGQAHGRIGAALRADRELRAGWSDAIGVDLLESNHLAEWLLADALAANSQGTVLYGTANQDRVRSAASIVDAPPNQMALRRFRELAQEMSSR